MKVKVLKAIPAAGKTKAILENIQVNNELAIVASISRQLSRQSFDYFESLGGQGVIIDTDNKRGTSSVNKALSQCVQDGVRVIFMTHQALLGFTEYNALNGFSLYIDEVPELITFDRFSFTHNLDKVLDYCEPITGELNVFEDLVLKEEHFEEMSNLASAGRSGADDVCATLFPLYKSLLQGIPTKIQLTESGSHCYFIDDQSTKEWDVFKQITIACANIEDTFTGMILKHFNGWEFEESELQSKLLFEAYKNSSRITINVMMEQSWSKHSANIESEGITNYTRMKNIIEGLVKEKDFIYTRNSYRARFSTGLEVPYNPHGLNGYNSFKNVAVMFSFNPLPWQIPLLRELACSVDLNQDDLVDAYVVSKYLEPAFQLCARSNIRVTKSNAKINLFVPDLRLAEYMKEHYFKDAIINTSYMIKAPEKKTTRERKSFQKMFKMDKKEKYKYMYLLRKVGRVLDTECEADIKLVSEWITKSRSKVIT